MSAPFANITGYYDQLVERYGHDPRACDYGRAESQAIKFAVLADVADLSGVSLLDVGCGFADFAEYLHGRFDRLAYTGIDLSSRMIAKAKELRPHLDLRVSNLLELPASETYDLITANGIFYLLGDNALSLMQHLIGAMFAKAKSAVAFNSLSSWTADQEPGEFYADPLETVAFCRTLSPWVVLRHDYHTRDFTIYLYKNRNPR